MTIPLEYLAVGMMCILLFLIFLGVRLGFAMMAVGFLFGLYYRGPAILSLFMNSMFGVMQNSVLIAIPLFVFMGILLEKSGVAEKLFDTVYRAMGSMRGSLALTVILISTLFAACTGVIAASVTTMALVGLPAMIARKYDHGLACGVVCAGGSLGILIPPSVMLVVMGPMCNLSVTKLFAGAFMPGFLLSVLYILYVIVISWLRPEVAPAISKEELATTKGQNMFLKILLYALPMVFLLVAVLGSIMAGITAPTEASALGVVGAALIAFAYRHLTWRTVFEATLETVKVTSMVLFVNMGATMFTSVFMFMRGGRIVENLLFATGLGPIGIVFLMMFILFILGMVLDWIGILYIVVPIFLPVVIKLGFDPLYFVLMVAINLQMSFLTPPFASAIFFLRGVAPSVVATRDIYRGVIPFVALQAIALALCFLFPQIVLWLPSLGV
jgi:tripartite ATP-independent transporter DctM subunit